jgi:uncharacterized protein (TIGR02145 family)
MKKDKLWNFSLTVMGIILILTTGCSKDEDIKIPSPTGQVTDVEGNSYPTLTIGTQTWMVENLRTTQFNDGTEIPLITNNAEWSNLHTPAYCWYANEEANQDIYGAMYNTFAVNTGKLCPAGWHVPTDAEWTILTDFIGGEGEAGGKMKSHGTTHWNDPNTGANNASGFSGLPGGHRGSNGAFNNLGNNGYWWSTTELDSIYTRNRYLQYDKAEVFRHYGNNKGGFTVRCISD